MKKKLLFLLIALSALLFVACDSIGGGKDKPQAEKGVLKIINESSYTLSDISYGGESLKNKNVENESWSEASVFNFGDSGLKSYPDGHTGYLTFEVERRGVYETIKLAEAITIEAGNIKKKVITITDSTAIIRVGTNKRLSLSEFMKNIEAEITFYNSSPFKVDIYQNSDPRIDSSSQTPMLSLKAGADATKNIKFNKNETVGDTFFVHSHIPLNIASTSGSTKLIIKTVTHEFKGSELFKKKTIKINKNLKESMFDAYLSIKNDHDKTIQVCRDHTPLKKLGTEDINLASGESAMFAVGMPAGSTKENLSNVFSFFCPETGDRLYVKYKAGYDDVSDGYAISTYATYHKYYTYVYAGDVYLCNFNGKIYPKAKKSIGFYIGYDVDVDVDYD